MPLTQRDIQALALHHVLNHTAARDLAGIKVPHDLEFIHKGAVWQVISAALFEALYLLDLARDCTDLNIAEWYNGKLFVHTMQCVCDNQLGSLKLTPEEDDHVTLLTQQITAGLESRVAVPSQRKKSNSTTPIKPRTNSGSKTMAVKPTSNPFDALSQEDSMEIDDDEWTADQNWACYQAQYFICRQPSIIGVVALTQFRPRTYAGSNDN